MRPVDPPAPRPLGIHEFLDSTVVKSQPTSYDDCPAVYTVPPSPSAGLPVIPHVTRFVHVNDQSDVCNVDYCCEDFLICRLVQPA